MVDALSSHVQKDPPTNNEADTTVDVNSWASRVTLDIIGVAGLGQDFHSIKDPSNELIQTYKTIFAPSRIGQIFGILGLFIPRWILSSIP